MANYGAEIVQLTLDDLNIDIKRKSGEWGLAKCPLHNDSSPSFSVNLESGGWKCFSGCGSSNDLAQLIYRINGGDIKIIRNRLESLLASDEDILERVLNPKVAPVEEREQEPIFYERNKMYPYLFNRGFTPAILKEWNVGIDSLTKSIAIPVTVDNRLVGIVKRSVVGPKEYKNSFGMDRTHILFGLDRIPMTYSWVVVLESPLDVIWCHQHGIHNVVATFGNALSAEQAALLLKRFWVVVLAYDNDLGGENFRVKTHKMLDGKIELSDVRFPEGKKDANDCNEETLAILFRNLYNETERNTFSELPQPVDSTDT